MNVSCHMHTKSECGIPWQTRFRVNQFSNRNKLSVSPSALLAFWDLRWLCLSLYIHRVRHHTSQWLWGHLKQVALQCRLWRKWMECKPQKRWLWSRDTPRCPVKGRWLLGCFVVCFEVHTLWALGPLPLAASSVWCCSVLCPGSCASWSPKLDAAASQSSEAVLTVTKPVLPWAAQKCRGWGSRSDLLGQNMQNPQGLAPQTHGNWRVC